ncbi:tyrosine--tRNA ligase [Aminithiophilus ramosus]|uniref:Tyrosine--tRNA ligase n=2 Tax=Synergistales TaxID=649776 RepID=A0A9Q7ABS5_9BACT|nr:tyrosine--tRNA ligase [Aminithiophilus ramosus]QTX33646.1 tyrosine--tRNA ligase [Aminithiophilus ramosus]QVL37540.1 tyrosine--tRNA ligase [Synergistota bacterium]
MFHDALDVLRKRGFIEWCSHPESLGDLFKKERVSAYIGFDPTADSLHVGHLIPIMGLAWLQRLGHRPIALAGGGTGMIGDPSGKTAERMLLTVEKVRENVEAVKLQLAHFLDFEASENGALLVNNYDWLGAIGLIDFLRETGKHFTVNYLLGREYVRSRLEDPEKSISFTEFSYSLLQARDFQHLMETYGCKLQMGGNDQQGNIISGIDLIRKTSGAEAFGITYPLLLDSAGNKFGKTAGGAVWLSAERTSPYRFFQFWINSEDSQVEKLLKLYTFLPLEEIASIMAAHAEHPERREAQRILARQITTTVHGEGAAKRSERASEILFGGAFDAAELDGDMFRLLAGEVPFGQLTLRPGYLLAELLVDCGACASRGEAKRLLRGGGVTVNGTKVDDESASLKGSDLLSEGYLLLRLGKRRFHLLRLS